MKTRLIRLICALLLGASPLAHATGYTLPDLDGHLQSLDQYRGKWIVVNYWATWCGTCRKELPDLASLARQHRDGDIVVVGINFEDIDTSALKTFVASQDMPYRVLRTRPIRKTPLGPVPALPTTYIIDPTGKTVAGEIGLVTQRNLEDYIASQRRK